MSRRPKVFVSAPLMGREAALRGVADVMVGDGSTGVRALLDGLHDFDALVALLTDRIDGALLDHLPRLRLVANVAVGVDHVDLAACAARGVLVSNTPGVLTEATADLTLALMLSLLRRVVEGDRAVRDGRFPPWTLDGGLGASVSGATLGIVGLGRIGQAVARRARGFSMRVLYTGPRRPETVERELDVTWTTLDELVAGADVVSLHCPLTTATRHLFDAARFAAMKPGAFFVNTARGGCVDEPALAAALVRGHLGGAAIDVFEHEPHVHPSLLDAPRTVLTPHVGSAVRETRERMAHVAVENVLAWIDGRPLPTPVAAPRG